MPYFYLDERGQMTTRPPGGSGGGGFGDLNFGGELNFDVEMPEPPEISVDFDKEAYRESIVAPAEQARKDATLEAIQQARATAAMTGRPAGDVEADILGESVKQAGRTSAEAAKATEEAGLRAEVSESQLAMQKYQVDVQKAIAQQELKLKFWSFRQELKSKFIMLRMQLDNERSMLIDRLGFEAGEAEANRRHQMEMQMFEIQSGMSMLKLKEDHADMRAVAGLAADERESLRDHSYRMQYLDAWRKIEGMKTLLDWRQNFGRASVYTRPKAGQPSPPPQPQEDYDYGMNWWEDERYFNYMPP